jgi:hypothetical protein
MIETLRNILQWTVCPDGYRCARQPDVETAGISSTNGELSRRRANEQVIVPNSSARRTYSPADHPGLFRSFAQLDGSPESIIGFANAYGVLADDGDPESVSDWRPEIREMSRVLTAWDLLRGRIMVIDGDVLQRVLGDESRAWQKSMAEAPQVLVAPLHARLTGLIETIVNPPRSKNVIVADRTRALLLPHFLVWDDNRRVFRREPTQTTLLVFLWSQAIESLTDGSDWKRCAYPPCSSWFEVSRGQNGRTKRARFCTDSHRALASRLRRPGSGKAIKAKQRSMARRGRPTAKND